ncbi:unnamed protein product [Discosporangium mesarthrocarpum]
MGSTTVTSGLGSTLGSSSGIPGLGGGSGLMATLGGPSVPSIMDSLVMNPRIIPPPPPPPATTSEPGVAATADGVGIGAEAQEELEEATPETVLREINELRVDPPGYAEKKLAGLADKFEGTMFNSPTGPPVATVEGVKALEDAMVALRATKPLLPLRRVNGMDQASDDHVKDLCTSGQTGHMGSDGSKASERINRYGQFSQVAGEVLAYYEATPRGIVAQLVISDGERARQKRKTLLGQHFQVCGIALGAHRTVGAVCAITLAGGFGPKPLGRPADVTCDGGGGAGLGAKTEELDEILQSVPGGQVKEEVEKCLRAGLKVRLEYSPGRVKCTFTQPSGAQKIMNCKWG